MNNSITPIFLVGGARNGTTNLENTIASLPQVAAVEHWLHYGSCESSIYMNQLHWGNISNVDNYINFLFQYSCSDYFQLAKGDLEFHLKNRAENFYHFFFELMDEYAKKEGKEYWISKFDPRFFIDSNEKNCF